MKKTFLASILCAALLVLTACGDSSPTASYGQGEKVDPSLPGDSQTLEAFHSIEVDVLAADIQILPGEDWSLSYNLSEKEPLKHFGVEQGTLYVETSFDPSEHFEHKNWFVTITVPTGTSLDEVELDTLSGNVDVQGFSCDSISLSSTSGNVTAQDITAREVELDSTSGKITASNVSANSLEAESISDDLRVEGTFGKLELSTTSGDIEATGSISIMGTLESVSGDIAMSLNHAAALQASSTGTILLNGAQVSAPVTMDGGAPVKVKSISGDLILQTNS